MGIWKGTVEGVEVNMKDKFWTGKKVLVTGFAGFVGSWLTEDLVRRGAEVVGLVHDSLPKNKFSGDTLSRMILAYGSLEDLGLLQRLIAKYEIEFVFHLGAQTQVTIANSFPLQTFKANIEGTWNILEAARTSSVVPKVIIASSDKAYGIQKKLPYTENAPLQGSFPYDVSKSCVDLLSKSYFSSFKLPVCITRCGNIYGGGDLNFIRLVPGTIRWIINNQIPELRSDGSFRRDYNYVENIVDGYVRLAEVMAKDSSIFGEAFNLSNDDPKSAMIVMKTICRLMGRADIKPKILNSAVNEIPHQYLRASKARRILGWKPQYTLEEGLKKTIEWYTDYFNKQKNG